MQNADMLKGAVRLVAQLDENFPEIINADEIYAIKLDDDTGFIMIYPESDNNSFKVSICFNSSWITYNDEDGLDEFLGMFDWFDEKMTYMINPNNCLSAGYTLDMEKFADSPADYTSLLYKSIKRVISASYKIDDFFSAFLHVIFDCETLF